jgi:hypothetical protein
LSRNDSVFAFRKREYGQIGAQSKAIPKVETASEVQEELITNERGDFLAVAIKDEGFVSEIAYDSDSTTTVTAQIERVGRKPFAATLGRIEAV